MAGELLSIGSDRLSAAVSTLGAELQTLRDAEGRDLLWDGDPAFWTGRAPILFPVVGVVANDEIRVDGRAYPMAKHGFARRRRFTPVDARADAVTLRLAADDETRRHYPFDFRLDLTFSIADATLTLAATIANEGAGEMPASFGFHPALRWPLPYGQPRAAHRFRFARPEPAPIRRIDGAGLLRPAPEPTPIEGDTLVLRDALFEDDAVILDRPASRALTYGAEAGPRLDIAWDLPMLGTWTKPGAGYICVEPWAGIADPEGFTGEFRDKPGVAIVPAGGAIRHAMHITLTAT